jgi:ABC-type Fe3+ transport system permease subunit
VTVANSTTNADMTAAHGAHAALPAALTDGFGQAFLVGAGIAVVGLLVAALTIRGGTQAEPEPAPEGEGELVAGPA